MSSHPSEFPIIHGLSHNPYHPVSFTIRGSSQCLAQVTEAASKLERGDSVEIKKLEITRVKFFATDFGKGLKVGREPLGLS